MRPSRLKKKRAIIVTTLIVLSFVVSAVAAGLTMASWWTADSITRDIVSLHDAELQGDARYASGVRSKAFSFPLSTRLCQAHRYRRVRPGRLHFRGLVLHTEKHRDDDIRSEFGSGERDVSVLRFQQHYRVSQGTVPYTLIAITP